MYIISKFSVKIFKKDFKAFFQPNFSIIFLEKRNFQVLNVCLCAWYVRHFGMNKMLLLNLWGSTNAWVFNCIINQGLSQIRNEFMKWNVSSSHTFFINVFLFSKSCIISYTNIINPLIPKANSSCFTNKGMYSSCGKLFSLMIVTSGLLKKHFIWELKWSTAWVVFTGIQNYIAYSTSLQTSILS